MTFKEYWDDLMTKIPIKDGQTVKMTKQQFYISMKNAFTKGFYSGTSKIKEVPKTDHWQDLFGDLFKK